VQFFELLDGLLEFFVALGKLLIGFPFCVDFLMDLFFVFIETGLHFIQDLLSEQPQPRND
jgi:hypothetical protein